MTIEEYRARGREAFAALPAESRKQGIGIVVRAFDFLLAPLPPAPTQKVTNPALFDRWLGNIISPNRTKEVAFHAALAQEFITLRIDARGGAQQTLELEQPANHGIISHALVVVEAGARAVIIDHGRRGIAEIVVERGAQVTFVSLDLGSEHDNARDISWYTKGARLAQDASITWIEARLPSTATHQARWSTTTDLAGAGANARSFELFFARGDQQFQLATEMRHTAPHTTSDILVKGVLDDRAKALYQGLIRIEQQAGTSNGYQQEDALLLSDTCEIDPVPHLEILTNDVKCGHGSTTTHIDQEKLFYAMSRGIDEATATRQVIEGFFDAVVRELPTDNLRTLVREEISRHLGGAR